MILHARCEMTVETEIPSAAVLMIEPVSGNGQLILNSSVSINPPTQYVTAIDSFGNACQRLILPQGVCVIAADITANVPDGIDIDPSAPFTPVQDLPDNVQCDLLLDLATRIIGTSPPGYAQVAAIRDWIHQKVEYKYGTSGPSTTAVDTANNLQGVCRDYAHLGIALCRALRIPARMVSGFLYQLEPSDLHAWFEAFVGGRWYTIDATQTEARGNRIILAYGRDAADIAQMSEYGNVQMKGMSVLVEPAA